MSDIIRCTVPGCSRTTFSRRRSIGGRMVWASDNPYWTADTVSGWRCPEHRPAYLGPRRRKPDARTPTGLRPDATTADERDG